MRRAVALLTLVGCLTFAVMACASTDDDATKTLTAASPKAQHAATGVRLVRIGTFDQPTYLASPPGDRTRHFVVEREGRIVLLRKGRKTTFLDISSRVRTGGEEGLLSMAFHPKYATNRRYFVYYVALDGSIVITQFRATPNGDATRRGSGRRVLRQPHPNVNHKGGQLQFGHDGRLYAGFGDGGGSGDPHRNAQSLGTMLGKLIRIDPKPDGGYAIPRDNPLRGRRGARPEIFAYGLRNPWRFSFDRRTGDLTLGDVGQNAVEEIDFLKASRGARRPRGGVNFGWSVFEGRTRFRDGTAPGHVPPLIQRFHRSGSCSITGGYVIRDRSMGSLRGAYVYGDFCDSRLRIARISSGRLRGGRLLGVGVDQLASFGEDARGRVYAVSLGGDVFRLAPRR